MSFDAAKWIESSIEAGSTLPIFRHVFTVDKPIDLATVDLCGLGQFELRVNGVKVGEDVLEPAWTNYSKTCLYVTRDIKPRLRDNGENTIEVLLGNGMYNVPSS